MTRRLVRATKRGFTLLEALIGGAVLAVLLGLSMGLFYNVNRDVGDGLALADAAAQANRAAKEIQRQLAAATQIELGGASLSPGGKAYTSARYRVVTGYDFAAGGAQAGEARQLRFVAGEPGRLELVRPGGAFTLLEDVEAQGLAFAFLRADGTTSKAASQTEEDTALLVTFVRWQRLPRDGEVHRERRELRIALRNPPEADE